MAAGRPRIAYVLGLLQDMLRRALGLGTVTRVQMVTRDGGRTYESWQVDRRGRQIGPSSKSFHDVETIASGLAAIPERVAGFVASSATSLVISPCGANDRCCSLLRCRGQMQMTHVFIGWRQHPERMQRVMDVFAREGIAPVHDARGESEAILHFPLPDSVERIASLCANALALGHGIADGEPLQFTLIRYS